jgi:hypothetical protein
MQVIHYRPLLTPPAVALHYLLEDAFRHLSAR